MPATGRDGPEPWATVRVRLPDAPDGDAIDRLDALGLLLAAEPEVGGVERRDAGTLVGAAFPELWVYTTPPGLEAVRACIAVLAGTLQLRPEVTAEVHHDDDWRESWKRFYPPQVLGDGALLLRPSWVERRPDDPTREVVIDPGRAFGTGLHQSTRLCLDRLCALAATELAPTTVLDLGCGSGILALAAARLFPAARIRAVDMDPEAVQTTLENVALNGLGERIEVAEGTASQPGPAVQLLIANIRPEVLVPAAAVLRGCVADGGRVLLSGILVEEADAVREAYVEAGLVAVDAGADLVNGEWQAVELRAP